jgi:uncharacterized protein (DUF1800 family)
MGFLLLGSVSGLRAEVDLNGNGMSDVWEDVHQARLLVAENDSDGDGQTNGFESAAGTNPRDPGSRFQTSTFRYEGADVRVGWTAQLGKSYRVLMSLNLSAWSPVSEYQVAGMVDMEAVLTGLANGSANRFFKVQVKDVDTDNDGVSDWEERQLPGFNPALAQSAQAGVNDLTTLTQMLSGEANTVAITAPVATAVEKEAVDGVFRIARTGGLHAVSVKFSRSGNANAQRASATTADYTLRDASGAILAGEIQIPFGVASVDVVVRPAADTLIETPETLTLTLAADASYHVGAESAAAVSITDAAKTSANERMFLAYLVPSADGTYATGLSTVRLQGDNATAYVSVSFSGLTATQTRATIDLENGGTGADVKSMPRGQVVDNVWPVQAGAFLTTDQAMLDALFAGSISAEVSTSNFAEGEIRGNYQRLSGSTEPPVPSAPPAIATLTGEELKREVARFLTQATFGPTQSEIDDLTTAIETTHAGDRMAGYAAWIDAQFALDPTSLEAYTLAADTQDFALRGTDPINYTFATGDPGTHNRRHAWWAVAIGAKDQLRQRAAFALSEIFVISDKAVQLSRNHYGAAHYYDQLVAHATGNYRTLLEDVSKSPIMGVYLSHLKNQKALYDTQTGAVLISPDENYAREIMQLFSIGLVALHQDGSLRLNSAGAPIPIYSINDITELSRVMTGWSYSKVNGTKASGYPVQDNTVFTKYSGIPYFQASWTNPMMNFAEYHDTGAKNVLGMAIPAGLDGEQDLDAALDILFAHANVAPFISRLLIQRLVTSNPSAGYIHRVAQVFINDGAGVRGNLGAVFKAILLDPEARSPAVAASIGFGKQKEPLVRYAQVLRALGAVSQLRIADLSAHGYPASQLDNFAPGATRIRFNASDTTLGQTPQSAPTVFNWFLPNYTPGGAITAAGLVAPEMQITQETQIVQCVNFVRSVISGNSQAGNPLPGATNNTLDDIVASRAPWETLYNTEIAAGKTVTQAVTTVVDRLDMLLLAGNLKARYAGAPSPNPRASIITAGVNSTGNDRMINILYLVTSSPEFLHQK